MVAEAEATTSVRRLMVFYGQDDYDDGVRENCKSTKD